MPQIYDMGPPALLPLRRKACWGIFPTASARFEPGYLGTKDQHATPRPPTPLRMGIVMPETCWAYHKCNKTLSSIYLVLLLHFLQRCTDRYISNFTIKIMNNYKLNWLILYTVYNKGAKIPDARSSHHLIFFKVTLNICASSVWL
jgi:hypothetical protein